jgi:hypothetical protein
MINNHSSAALCAITPAVDPVESIEQPRQVFGRDPRPAIAHADHDVRAFLSAGHTNLAAWRCIADSVIEQVQLLDNL